jgi:N-formylglutamate deformylase
MTDEEFLVRFEALQLPDGGFHHRDHVRVAWIYLRRFPVLEALGRLSAGLAAFARSRGVPERYHQTITWGYFFLIGERMARATSEQCWDEFARDNADLLSRDDDILRRYYRDETLRSALAREVFVLPDRGDRLAAGLIDVGHNGKAVGG